MPRTALHVLSARIWLFGTMTKAAVHLTLHGGEDYRATPRPTTPHSPTSCHMPHLASARHSSHLLDMIHNLPFTACANRLSVSEFLLY